MEFDADTGRVCRPPIGGSISIAIADTGGAGPGQRFHAEHPDVPLGPSVPSSSSTAAASSRGDMTFEFPLRVRHLENLPPSPAMQSSAGPSQESEDADVDVDW